MRREDGAARSCVEQPFQAVDAKFLQRHELLGDGLRSTGDDTRVLREAQRLDDRWRGHSDFVEECGMDVRSQEADVLTGIRGLEYGPCDAKYERPKAARDVNVDGARAARVTVNVVHRERPGQRTALEEMVDTRGLGMDIESGLWA